MERANGESAQATLKGKFVYSKILLATNNLQEAKKIYKDILARLEILLCTNSFITKDSNYVHGEVYRLLGKLDKAE